MVMPPKAAPGYPPKQRDDLVKKLEAWIFPVMQERVIPAKISINSRTIVLAVIENG
jgi:hypothetical protein